MSVEMADVPSAARSSWSDGLRVTRAIVTNQVARFAPSAYVRLTRQTGRGDADAETPAEIAQYFRDCVDAFFDRLGVAPHAVAAWLAGKVLMEYGPGDVPGVAALMVARGADKVYCVDRFPLLNLSPKNARVLTELIDGCHGAERERLLDVLADRADPARGFDPRRIEVLVRPSGLSGLGAAVDMVYSRAVLEHVDDLEATFADMCAAMRRNAVAIHQVDLRSHGLHRASPLDFLEWSPTLWRLMYSQKGVPNRWRVDRYRRILEALGVDVVALEPTQRAAPEHVALVRPRLAAPFRGIADDELGWLGFWLVFRPRAG